MAQASQPRIGSSVGTPSSWRRSRVGDHVFKGVSVAMGIGLIGLLAFMLWELSFGGYRAFAKFGIHFIIGRNWKPVFDHRVEPFLTATIGRVPLVGALFRGAKYCLEADVTNPAVCHKFGYNSNGGDLFTAGVILAIMILPIVTAVTREVVAVVPG